MHSTKSQFFGVWLDPRSRGCGFVRHCKSPYICPSRRGCKKLISIYSIIDTHLHTGASGAPLCSIVWKQVWAEREATIIFKGRLYPYSGNRWQTKKDGPMFLLWMCGRYDPVCTKRKIMQVQNDVNRIKSVRYLMHSWAQKQKKSQVPRKKLFRLCPMVFATAIEDQNKNEAEECLLRWDR